MVRGKPLSKAEKYRIADLYQNTDLTVGAIAEIVKRSKQIVSKYKGEEIDYINKCNCLMSKGRNVSIGWKRRIADIYQHTDLTMNEIANIFHYHISTIQKYKDYKVKPTRIKKTPSTDEGADPWDYQRQTMLGRLNDQCRKKLSLDFDKDPEYNKTILRNYIKNYMIRKRKIIFSDLPEYQNMDEEDMIIDIADNVFENLRK